jgi:hypothetical protein
VSGIFGVPAHPLRDVDARCRRRREYLAGSLRVACQQQVPAIGLESRGAGDGALGHPLPPRHVRDRRHRTEVSELDAFDRRCEVGLDCVAGRGLARAARAGEEKQHESILTWTAT